MKEIKAYVRPALAHRVIEALRQEGVSNISLVRIKGIGLFEDPQRQEYDLEFIEKSSDMVKLEIICNDAEADRFAHVIMQQAHTGKPGDGLIFITNVQRTIKIKTGEEGIG